ncbi:MAG: mechanosensitive ion channel family protein [bacterium]|nr:mechanosensitive ion channel family protein [bacterium]
MDTTKVIGLDKVYLGNKLSVWVTALVVSITLWLVLQIAKSLTIRRIHRLAKKTDTKFDDGIVLLIQKTKPFFLLLIGLYFGSKFLILTPKVELYLFRFFVVFFSLQIILWGNALIEFFLYERKKNQTDTVVTSTTFGIIGFVAKLVVWSVVLLIMLSNLGVNITAVITGLGVGGIAIALATQKILGDIFSSFIIVFDKPFEVGDFIVINEFRGRVERIGLKTTRLRSISGEEIIIPNSNLIDSRIQNFRRMEERRVQFTFNVEYTTPKELLEQIPMEIKKIIDEHGQTKFDYCGLRNLGEHAFQFETAYFITDRDFQLFVHIHHEINLKIVERFRELGVKFAYPTRTVQVLPNLTLSS